MNQAQIQTAPKPQYKQAKYKGEAVAVTQSSEVTPGMIIGMAQHIQLETNVKRFGLCVIDLDDADFAFTSIPLSFFGHGVVPDPAHSELVTMFEKRGRGACEINLKQGAVTRTIETGLDRAFYGHGAYSADHSLLYSTETIVTGDYHGVIAVRDANTHKYLAEFPSFGSSPHDCHLIDDGKVMVVTNGGGAIDGIAPNVSYIDVNTEKLIDKLEFDAAHINAGHLAITDSGKLAVVSAQRSGLPEKALGGISIKQSDGVLHTLTEPAKLINRLYDESLSVCIHEKNNIVATTTPAGNLLSFWNLDSGELLHYYILQNPRGVELTLDGKYFVVSYGQGEPQEAMMLISSDTLEHVSGFDLTHTGITGSHLTAYSFPPEMRG